MGIDVEALIVPAVLAGLAAWAFLAVTAGRADLGRALVDACRRAVDFRDRQEKLAAAGRPAPYLDYARRAESELRDLLRRRGF